jgi:hypothetical protein
MYKYISFLALILLTSCYKDGLYVQQEWIDEKFLASSRVETPDPRAEHPPKGQRLVVGWDFPRSIYLQKLSLFLTVRFMDQKQKVYFMPLKNKRGVESFYFSNLKDDKQKKILTYKVVVLNEKGVEVANWKHHFWTNLIEVDQSTDEKSSSPEQSSSLVDSKSRQGSVTEQP